MKTVFFFVSARYSCDVDDDRMFLVETVTGRNAVTESMEYKLVLHPNKRTIVAGNENMLIMYCDGDG